MDVRTQWTDEKIGSDWGLHQHSPGLLLHEKYFQCISIWSKSSDTTRTASKDDEKLDRFFTHRYLLLPKFSTESADWQLWKYLQTHRKSIVMFRANREAATQMRIQIMVGSIQVNVQSKRRHFPEVVWTPLLSPATTAWLSIWDLHFLRSRLAPWSPLWPHHC